MTSPLSKRVSAPNRAAPVPDGTSWKASAKSTSVVGGLRKTRDLRSSSHTRERFPGDGTVSPPRLNSVETLNEDQSSRYPTRPLHHSTDRIFLKFTLHETRSDPRPHPGPGTVGLLRHTTLPSRSYFRSRRSRVVLHSLPKGLLHRRLDFPVHPLTR